MKLLKAIFNLVNKILMAVLLLPFWFMGYMYIHITISKAWGVISWAFDEGKKSAVQRKLKSLRKKGSKDEQNRP